MYPSVIDYVRGLSREYTGEVVYYEEFPGGSLKTSTFHGLWLAGGWLSPTTTFVRGLVALLKSTTSTQVDRLFTLFPNPDSNSGCGAYWLILLAATATGVREDKNVLRTRSLVGHVG